VSRQERRRRRRNSRLHAERLFYAAQPYNGKLSCFFAGMALFVFHHRVGDAAAVVARETTAARVTGATFEGEAGTA